MTVCVDGRHGRCHHGWSSFVVDDGGGVGDDLSEGFCGITSEVLDVGAAVVGDKNGLTRFEGCVVAQANDEFAGTSCGRSGWCVGGTALDVLGEGERRSVGREQATVAAAGVLDLDSVSGQEGSSSGELEAQAVAVGAREELN